MSIPLITRLYTEYISLMPSQRLHAGELLAESARLLLQMDAKGLYDDAAIQRQFFLWKIAEDLSQQVIAMANTRQYDLSPAVTEYSFLAYDLAFEGCERRPCRLLLPYLRSMIYYAEQKADETRLKELRELLASSLADEEEVLKRMREW
jgi:hypothetical protein